MHGDATGDAHDSTSSDCVVRCRLDGACRIGRARAAGAAGRADGRRTVKIAWIDPLSGLMRRCRQEPAQELPVHRRAVQHEQPGRREVRDGADRQQAQPAGEPERAEVGDRPGRPLRHAGQRLGGGAGADRCGEQAQRAQSGQGGGLPELRGGRSRPHQQQVQLLALPLRRRHVDEDGGADHLHEGPARRQEGLPDQPELLARPAGRASSPRRCWRASGPTSRSSATTCTRWPGARLRALRRQDQGLGRRHGDHRQLGLRPDAAGQGGATTPGYNGKFYTYYAGVTGTPTALGPPAPAACTRSPTRTPTWPARCGKMADEFKTKFNDDFYTGSIHPRLRRCWAQPWPRPRRPTRSRWPRRWKA